MSIETWDTIILVVFGLIFLSVFTAIMFVVRQIASDFWTVIKELFKG